jgi:uncharacterized protein
MLGLAKAGTELVVSDLTRMECRLKPLREGDDALLADYDQFFAYSVTETLALSREVIDRATEIRAEYGIKTPDAIHLAAAIVAGCDAFLTNDRRLDRFAGIPVEVVAPTTGQDE